MVTSPSHTSVVFPVPQRVFITGALGGIGLPTVKLLRDLGSSVVACDLLDETTARAAHSEILEGVDYVACDITIGPDIDALISSWSDADLPPAVCSLAGMVTSSPMLEQSAQDMLAVFNLNFHAQVRLAQTVTKRWIETGTPGHFIFVSSWVQDVPWHGIGPYSPSKAALRSIARTFSREHAADAIRYNVLAPGIVATGMAQQQWDTEPDYQARAARAIPLGRLQPAESVAQSVAFLCSTWAQYMTGSTLLVDGGASLYPMDPHDVRQESDDFDDAGES